MQTEKAYYHHTSAEPFSAAIVELRPAADGAAHVILDKTLFYPEGGGQPSDRGTINGVSLLGVREKDGEIVHVVSAEDSSLLAPGPAELVLDSRRRRDITVQHTGQHLLSGTIFRMTGAHTVSMHLGDETCTIDVEAAEMSEELLTSIEEAVADTIEENLPVIVHLCPPEDISSLPLRKFPPKGEDVIRVIEIQALDFSPCCGTHLASTAQIGILRILGAEKYKGMTRITFIAGRRALLDSRRLRQNAGVISRALSAPVNETGKAVLEFLEKTAVMEKRLKALHEESIRAKAGALADKANKAAGAGGPVIVVESYAEIDIDEALCIGKAAQKETEAVLVLASEREYKFVTFCSVRGFDLRPLIRETFEAQGGRGGGGPSFFQGSFGTKEALDAFLLALKK
ncbi:MAG: alanyl-tRNA editing protein [Treponema sp.]|nr:alanyl-tRNA editing protein [Treponema sp.]